MAWTAEQCKVVDACLSLRNALLYGTDLLGIIRHAPAHVQHIFKTVERVEEAHALAEEALLGFEDLRELWARGLAAQQVVAACSDGWQRGKGEKTRALEALRAALLRTRVQVGISEISAGRSRVPLLSEGGWTGAAVRPVRQMQHALPGDEGDAAEED